MDTVIKTEGLTKIFGDQTVAVDDLSIQLESGKIYGFLGPNGAGKSTTIHLLIGILTPTYGRMLVLGKNPCGSAKYHLRSRIGFMPQETALYDDLSPLEHCIFFGRLNGLKKKKAKRNSEEILELFGLTEKLNTPVRSLSGGMKRRTSLAIALVHKPELIILDEPTVGVDPVLRRNFWAYFRELKSSEQKVTFLITTHVFDEVNHMEEILMMYRGRLIERGTPNYLKHKYSVSTLEDIFLQMNNGNSISNREKAKMEE